MRSLIVLIPALLLATLAGTPAAAQLGLPGGILPPPGRVLGPVEGAIDNVRADARDTIDSARDMLRERERTISRFLRRNGDFVEADRNGNPARRGELLVMDLDPAGLAKLREAGFTMLGEHEIEGLGFAVTRLALPRGRDLAEGEAMVAALAPAASVAPDNIHFQSGGVPSVIAAQGAASAARIDVPVGMIDGAPSARIGAFPTRGFATGAPRPSDHGSAVAHLLSGAGVRDVRVADVYGTDKAGGSALAIAQGLGWLVGGGSRVVSISLVGPRNAVVERAIAAAQRRGTVVVAAVGNDGPAAPPSYPASYDGVVAVTGVDGRNRALIEAGRALHLDYAAPGADLTARNAAGRLVRLRGTSFATPLAAARIAAALARGRSWRAVLDSEAEDLGAPGPDEVFGRGLLCGSCRDL